jgi:DNA-binding transcriptional LysR family regulator
LSDSIEEMISEGIDVAIRYGELPDSRLVARRLLNNDRILCASPGYLAQNGTPQILDELYQHHCIIISRHTEINWAFPSQTLHIQQAISCNDGEAAHAMALNGMGIVLKSYWDVAEDLSTGKLVQVLPEQAVISAPINVITLKNQHQPARIRLFIDFLLNSLQTLEMRKDRL